MTTPISCAESVAELAERVEALTGPDADVNEAILIAIGWTQNGRVAFNPFGEPVVRIPNYLESLDDAMTLVPEGWTFANLSQSDRRGWWCELRRGFLTSYDKVAFGNQLENTNAAVAITAAALRARASQEQPA